jgi:hypothetical protein
VGSAATLTTRVQVLIGADLQNVLDLVTSGANTNYRKSMDLANGTGANQANVIFSDQRTLSSAATEDLDLAGGGLTDPLGTAFAPARIKCVMIASASGNTTNLTLLGDTNSVPVLSTAATTIVIAPGGVFTACRPDATAWAVTAGTGDIIQVANASGASAVYDVILVGSSS